MVFSHLSSSALTQSKTILTSVQKAMAIFRTSGIRIHSVGITKRRLFCFAITKNSSL